MRWFISALVLGACCLWTMSVTAQDKGKSDGAKGAPATKAKGGEDAKAKQKRIKELQDKQAEIQKELEKEGVPPSTTPLGPPGKGPIGLPGAGRGIGNLPSGAGPGQDPTAVLKVKIEEMEEALAAQIEQYGEDSEEVAQTKKTLDQLKQVVKQMGRSSLGGFGSGMMPNLDQVTKGRMGGGGMMGSMGGMAGSMGGLPMVDMQQMEFSKEEMGQLMVVQGIESQIRGLGTLRENSPEDADKAEIDAKIKELAGDLIAARKKAREGKLARLEKQIAKLKEEASKDEDVDAIIKDVLESRGDQLQMGGGGIFVEDSDSDSSEDSAEDSDSEESSSK